LNSPPPHRKDSGDSINFRDTGFDAASGHRRNDSGGRLIQPIPVNNQVNEDLKFFSVDPNDEEEKEAEEQRRLEEEKRKN
jgi:hypothetical protein